MIKSKKRLCDRILAWILTLLMVVGTVSGHSMTAEATGATIAVSVHVKDTHGTSLDGRAKIIFIDFTSGEISQYSAGAEIQLATDTYKYQVNCYGYVSKEGTFEVSSSSNSLEIILEEKKVDVTFQTMKDGAALSQSGLSVYNGDTKLGETDANGKYKWNVQEGTAYSVTVSGGKYETLTAVTGIADTETVGVPLSIKKHTVTVNVKAGSGTIGVPGCLVSAQSEGGTTVSASEQGNGTYALSLEEGETYTVSASSEGFTIPSGTVTVSNSGNTVDLTATPIKPTFDLLGSNINITYPNESVTISLNSEKINKSGWTYVWKYDGAVTVDANGNVTKNDTATAGQTGQVWVECQYNGIVQVSSDPVSVTIIKGSTSLPTVNMSKTEDKNTLSAGLVVSGLPGSEKGKLTVTASGGNIDGTYTQTFQNVGNNSTCTVNIPTDKLDTSDSGNYLKGAVTYTYTFESNNYSYTPVNGTLAGNYYITKDLTAQVNEDNLVYGDERALKIDIAAESMNSASNFTYSFVDGEGNNVAQDVMEIASDGKITIKNAGTVNIKVTRETDSINYWAEESTVIENVTVEKKEINPIAEVLYSQVNAENRIYDHNKNVEATGVIPVQATPENNEGRLEAADADKIFITAVLELPSDDADTYNASADTITIKSYSLSAKEGATPEETAANQKLLNNYKLPETIPTGSITNGSFTIKPKELTVTILNTDNHAVNPAVGVVHYQELDNSALVTPGNLEIQVNGLVSDDDRVQLETLVIKPLQGLKDIREYADAITVDLTDKVKANSRSTGDSKKYNYTFASAGNQWATLKVVQEQLGSDVDSIISYDGTNVHTQVQEGNDIVWVQRVNGILKVNINLQYAARYDAVVYNSTDLHEVGIKSSDLSGIDELKVQLAMKDGMGGFKNLSSEIVIPFKLDEAAPITEFKNDIVETVTASSGLFKAISFGTFNKAVYTAEFTVNDKADEDGTEEGSGVNKVEAYVWKLQNTDLVDGKVSETAIKNKIDSIKANSEWNASEVTELGSQKYSVKVAKDSEGLADVIAGSYIVLVKVTDHVSNAKVYASNGIVVEVTEPSISVEFEGGKKAYYDGDVNYKITVNDETGLGVSGVSEVEWTVYCDGHKVDVNSGSVKLDKAANEQYTVTELGKVYENNLTIKVKDTKGNEVCNSNNIELVVSAKDRSGNEITKETIPLIIDITKPTIEVSYDNNDVKNGKYFNADRTATIVFTERNFDRVKATFDLTLENGTAYTGVTLDVINSIDGISAAWPADSQAGKAEKDYTDQRTNTAVITFSGDNAYIDFDVHCTDKAGNTDEGVTYASETAPGTATTFVVDKTMPVVDVKYYVDGSEISVGGQEAERIYRNQTIDAVITITEHNFAKGDRFAENQVKYTVETAKVGAGHTIPDYQAQADTVGTWGIGSDVHQSEKFVYASDANYTTGFEYTDLAGNTVKWLDGGKQYFTVDKTAPEGTIEIVGKGAWSKFINVVLFNLFSKTPLTVAMSKSDVTSPTYDIEYYKSYNALSLAEVSAVTSWVKADSYKVGANEQFIPYMKVTDYAGNVSYISSDSFAIVDDTKPLTKDTGKPVITITASEPAHGIYNSNVPFNISVEDPVAGNTYSGLASVKYEILKDDAVTASETLTYKAGESRTRTMSENRVVNASENNSNNVKIRVTAVDHAGNSAVEVKDIKIDITKPTIAITFDNNAPLNGKYYKETRTATVVVTERNFDESAFKFTITNTDGTQPSISGWSHSANSGVSDAATHTCTVSFTADGDYNMSAICTDLAGNTSDSVTVEEFTIDKTQPKIAVSYDNNSAQNGNYYKAARTATITITEHNFRAGDVKVSTTASRGAAAPTVSGWSTSGDRHTATIRFASDADYTFDIDYADLAGNAAADYTQDKFTVDLTNPELEISGVKNKSANKGTVAPTITMSDTNYTVQGVTVTLTGANKGKVNIDNMISRTSNANGQTITFRNFSNDMDDVYTLTAKIVDKAGNETSKSITFSVNRNGSTYIISDATQKLMATGFTNSPQDIVISEINVDTLEFIEISYTKDGQVVKLTEGTDYTVKEEGVNGQWKKYTYTIKAACFENEGQYSINIYSEDRAENSTTNAVKEKGVEFIVDKTAPTLVVSNLDNKGRYKENAHEFTLTVKDNTVLAYVELYLDGKLVKTYEGDELVVEDGVIKINVDSKDTYQNVKLVAYDAAGNPTEPVEYDVLVTTNTWIQFYNNKPLFFGTIAGIIVVAGAAIFLIAKRRKRG